MEVPVRRAAHGSLKKIAEEIPLKGCAVFEKYSQAVVVQQHMRKLGRKGQVDTRGGEVRVWRFK